MTTYTIRTDSRTIGTGDHNDALSKEERAAMARVDHKTGVKP